MARRRERGKDKNAALVSALRAKSAAIAEQIKLKDADLRARERALADLVAEKADVDAFIGRYTGRGKPVRPQRGTKVPAAPPSIVPETPEDSPFHGLSIINACLKALDGDIEGKTVREVWTALEAGGFAISAEEPLRRIQWELRKRSRGIGDVVLVGGGRYRLRKYISDEQFETIQKSLDGQAGRDSGLHSAQTRAGLARSKARGVRIGGEIKVTDELRAKFVRLVVDEGKKVTEAAKELKIAASTYYSRQTKDGISVLDVVNKAKKERGVSPSRRARKKSAQESVPDLLTPVAGNA